MTTGFPGSSQPSLHPLMAPSSLASSSSHPPPGTADLLPAQMRARAHLHERLLERLRLAGYQPVGVPSFEPFGLFGTRYGDELRERLFTFYADQEYALRPDFTGSIGRLVTAGSFAGEPLPLRICSSGPVFRYERLESQRRREFHQVSAELLGSPEGSADLELLALALEALSTLGLTAPTVALRHASALGDALRLSGLEPATQARLELLLANPLLPGKPNHAVDPSEDALLRHWQSLVRLEGSFTFVQSSLQESAPELLELPALVQQLQVAEGLLALGHTGPRIRPFAVRSPGYYTGLCFQIGLDAPGEAAPADPPEFPGQSSRTDPLAPQGLSHRPAMVVAGGRYDRLARLPSGEWIEGAGFAVDLDTLLEAWLRLHRPPPPAVAGLVVADSPDTQRIALSLARVLRDSGKIARFSPDSLSEEAALDQARREHIAWLCHVRKGHALQVWVLAQGRDVEMGRFHDAEQAARWLQQTLLTYYPLGTRDDEAEARHR